MKIVKSHFKFKGTREYVHGTDIYNYILDRLIEDSIELSKFSKFTLSFLRETISNVDFCIGTKDELQSFEKKDAMTFRGSVWENGKNLMFWATENGEKVTERYAYDEKKIEAHCTLENKQIFFDSKLSELSFIENLIPMNKKLLAVTCPQYKGKWMFTRLDLTNPIPKMIPDILTLETYQDSNPKLVCSNILVGQEKVGRIFFSLT